MSIGADEARDELFELKKQLRRTARACKRAEKNLKDNRLAPDAQRIWREREVRVRRLLYDIDFWLTRGHNR